MPESIDDKIEAAVAAINAHRDTLDQAIEAIIAATAPAIAAWAVAEARATATNNPARVAELGPDGLRRAKADVEAFNADLPALLKEHFGSATQQWHRQQRLSDPINIERNVIAGAPAGGTISEKVGRVITRFGTLLKGHGFRLGQAWQWPETKYEYEQIKRDRANGIDAAISEYLKGYTQLLSLISNLHALEAQKIASAATDAWDKA